jgi:glucose dehydrogenase
MPKITFGFKKREGKKRGFFGEKWKFDSKNTILSSPSVVDMGNGEKMILFGTKNGRIYALDKNSNVKWIYDASEEKSDVELMFLDPESKDSIYSPPNIDDINKDKIKEIIFGSESGKIYCLNHNGKLLWSYNTKGPVRGGALIHDINKDGKPEIIIGSGDKNLYIFDNKGKVLGMHNAGSPIESSPCIFEEKIVFGCNNGLIKAINFKGRLIWTFETNDKITARGIVGKLTGKKGESLLIGSHDGFLYALDNEGNLKWRFKTGGAIVNNVALDDINNDDRLEIVFGSCDNNIYALSCYGEKIWSYETDFWVVTTPIIMDINNDGKKEIIAGSYDHNIYVLDSEGSYVLDYVPGLGGVIQQGGNYSEVLTSEPGSVHVKKLWQFKTEGIIVGSASLDEKDFIINTEEGIVSKMGKKENNNNNKTKK